MKKSFIILISIVFISLMHYLTPVTQHHAHAVFQRLYYIPVIFAAWKLGLWRGSLYLPHILLQWRHHSHEVFTQLVEIAMIMVIAIVTGILSDREKQEQQAREYAQQQIAHMDRLALLGQLSAGLAHEIRNPLGALLGTAEILRKEVPAESKASPYVPILHEELKRMNGKLNQFLDFAKPVSPTSIPNDLNALIKSTLTLIEKEASNNQVTMSFQPEKHLSLYPMDSELLRQVLLNLLLNAIQAMPRGGKVHISSFGDKNTFGFTVSDEGDGISKEVSERLFEPFFTTKEKGTGLGLSIVQQLLRAMDGNISLKPSVIGATFEVRITV